MAEYGVTDRSKENGAVVIRCVSVGTFAALLLLLSDGVTDLSSLFGGGTPTRYVFVSALCAGVCCGLWFVARGTLRAGATYRVFGIHAGLAALIGLLACLFASYARLPEIIFIPAGAVFGFGIGMLAIGNGIQLCALSETRFLRVAAFGGLLASLLKLLLLVATEPWLIAGLILLLAVSSVALSATSNESPSTKDRGISVPKMAKGIVERNWVFFCGLMLCLLVSTLVWAGALSEQVAGLAPGLNSRLGTAIGSLIAALTLLLATRGRLLGRLRKATLYLPLLCIAIILLTWYIGVWHDGLNVFGGYSTLFGESITSVPVGFSMTLLATILMGRFRDEMANGLSPSFVFGTFVSLTSGLFLLLAALQSLLEWSVLSSIDSIAKISYLVVAAVYLIMLAQKQTKRATPLPDQSLQEAAIRFRLSKRETEMLALLVQGRSAPSIAKTEFIAVSTVKTHIKHLYAKIGAHNRVDLIHIIYEKDTPPPHRR
jgi:DNA-binding CsgD family transcriptional regulator